MDSFDRPRKWPLAPSRAMTIFQLSQKVEISAVRNTVERLSSTDHAANMIFIDCLCRSELHNGITDLGFTGRKVVADRAYTIFKSAKVHTACYNICTHEFSAG